VQVNITAPIKAIHLQTTNTIAAVAKCFRIPDTVEVIRLVKISNDILQHETVKANRHSTITIPSQKIIRRERTRVSYLLSLNLE